MKFNMKSLFNSKSLYVFLGLLFVCFVLYIFIKPVEYFDNAPSKKSLVYFYMQGCPHCEAFDKVWNDALSKLSTDLGIQKADMESNSKINLIKVEGGSAEAKRIEKTNNIDPPVTSFPTIYYIDGSKLTEYNDGRTLDAVVKFVKDRV